MKIFEKEFDAVILANGDYPTARIPLEVLSSTPYVVCSDGAANSYIEKGNSPTIIIGDGDSLQEEYLIKYAQIVHCISEQESNDLTKSVRLLIENGKHKIAIVGATGKREDHTIGNISLLIEYARLGAQVRMYTDYGVFIPCKGDCTIETYKGQQLSIFNFTAKKLKSEGTIFPIYDFVNWWQGTLNEAIGEKVSISADGEYMLFINY